jgi:hypothetical protein
MIFGVEGKGERRENSNGSVFVLKSCLIVLGFESFGVVVGGIIDEGVSESELLDEKVIRLRLDIDEEECVFVFDEDCSSIRLLFRCDSDCNEYCSIS